MRRLNIPLHEAERDALIELARRERRDPREQGALLIRRKLEEAGLLQPDATTAGETIWIQVANPPTPAEAVRP